MDTVPPEKQPHWLFGGSQGWDGVRSSRCSLSEVSVLRVISSQYPPSPHQSAGCSPGRERPLEDLSLSLPSWRGGLSGKGVSFLFSRSAGEAEICRGVLRAACGA